MLAHRPSQTAQDMAVQRAAHQLLDTPRLFDDPVAVRIIGREAEAALVSGNDSEFHEQPVQRGLRAHLVGRSRFAEDALAQAYARGVRQYVLLGAGLDTSSFRAARKYRDLAIFEVDHPATQTLKRERLAGAEIVLPAAFHFAPVDFESDTLSEGLARAGFDPGRSAMFVWLGVVPYLTHEAVMATLAFIAGLPRNSEVVFDFIEHRTEESQREALEQLKKRLADMGEPLRCHHVPAQFLQEIRDTGYSECETLDVADLNDRYFEGKMANFMKPVIGHLMRARV
jgi:methyltransferase (TIGR00027 family)